MSHISPVLTRKTLIDRIVFNAQTDQEMGYINQVWVDWCLHQVIGFTCSQGLGSQSRRSFHWSQIEAIGLDSFYVSFQRPNPSPFEISDTLDFRIGHSLYSDTGHYMGQLIDYVVDQNLGTITSYRFKFNRFNRAQQLINAGYESSYSLPPKAIGHIAEKQMTLRPGAARMPTKAMSKAITSA